ncbi:MULTISPECIES: DUF6584 family protein [unclassified Rathayibacter]|uniref:DUF6584 family protein n=1 Tax=unclassified Rathayibacter TaxID=2609250 RepID=UPI00188C1833|nr:MULTISPECIES: DUF6584 family protein [unclassified Rathayibacter]MBF4462003.1 hypothetical protein [Rathayibacter sp. VKM Ac-2879]MBF4503954.1 hypothetical protein [Rathayibacter sp. VKM Ac-2878]
MDTVEALDRAKTRFAEGDVRGAVSLLERCVEADPTWLDPRILLSELYRRSGDLIEAGRWGYLIESGAAPEELHAFERALVRSEEDPFELAERALVQPLELASESEHAAKMLAALPGRLEAAARLEAEAPDPGEGEWYEHEALAPPRRGGIVGMLGAAVGAVFVVIGVVVGAAALLVVPALLIAMLVSP